MTHTRQQIAEYYDATLPFYAVFWHGNSESYALHYGFWGKGTRTIKEALLNENKFLAQVVEIRGGEKILDAECGIGGSAIWLAKHFNVSVTGITLSTKQVHKARQLASKYDVEDRTTFTVQDFLRTDFSNASFDIVWAIESVCYAESKDAFLCEAYRLLKPGGTIVVADGFLKRNISEAEQLLYKDFLDGLALPNLALINEFQHSINAAGFANVQFWDMTEAVLPSSKLLYRRTSLLFPFAKVLHAVGMLTSVIFKNGPAGIAQYKLVQSRACGYGVFCGRK